MALPRRLAAQVRVGGIGLGIARGFLDEGASVVVNGRDPNKAEQTLAELNAGDRVLIGKLDFEVVIHQGAADVPAANDLSSVVMTGSSAAAFSRPQPRNPFT